MSLTPNTVPTSLDKLQKRLREYLDSKKTVDEITEYIKVSKKSLR